MLQNPCKTLGFKKNMVYKIPPGGGGKPYPASGLLPMHARIQRGGTLGVRTPWKSQNYRLSHDQMHFLYLGLVICSCDAENNVKTLYFCFREVLRDSFKRTNSIALNIID